MGKSILISKNRGWRGLAEIQYFDTNDKIIHSMIFSFSQRMWDNMIQRGKVVIQTPEKYIILTIDTEKLPRKDQQRSVLITNVMTPILKERAYSLEEWRKGAYTPEDYRLIYDFLANRNNHTTSNWNCIGIRVKPEI